MKITPPAPATAATPTTAPTTAAPTDISSIADNVVSSPTSSTKLSNNFIRQVMKKMQAAAAEAKAEKMQQFYPGAEKFVITNYQLASGKQINLEDKEEVKKLLELPKSKELMNKYCEFFYQQEERHSLISRAVNEAHSSASEADKIILDNLKKTFPNRFYEKIDEQLKAHKNNK